MVIRFSDTALSKIRGRWYLLRYNDKTIWTTLQIMQWLPVYLEGIIVGIALYMCMYVNWYTLKATKY